MFISGLIIFFFILITILTLIVLGIIAAFKKSLSVITRNRFFLLTPILIAAVIFMLQEFIFFPSNPKLDQLVFVGYRDMPISSNWLGLYDDNTWEFGISSREIESSGTYTFWNDTLVITTKKGTVLWNGNDSNTFYIERGYIWEIENTGLRGLEIVRDYRFKSEVWKAKGVDWWMTDVREKMVGDLIRSEILIGLDSTGVNQLLGKTKSHIDNQMIYTVREKYETDIDPVFIKELVVSFGKDGLVNSVEVTKRK